MNGSMPFLGLLACAPALAIVSGCLAGSSASNEPSPIRTAVERGDQRGDDWRARGFPGVAVENMRHGGFTVRILSGMVGRGDPLYVIDGAPMAIDPRRGIDWLKRDDILDIRMLKDPSQTAVYGARGVNGVIVITTKRRR
jgi:TonB-dependent SusC/RagA subfamily outer membrane receptor